MLRQEEGSRAVAEAVALCRPEVISAYPISPQTHIVEHLSDLVRTGDLSPCEYLMVESEFGAHLRRDRGIRHRRPHLYGDGLPGHPLHGGGALQRVRAWGCRS